MPGATATPHVDAPPRPSAFARPRLIAPHYLAIGGVAQIALDDLLPLAIFVGRPWSLLGWLPILVGVGIQLAAFARFRHHRTPVMPGRQAATAAHFGDAYRDYCARVRRWV